MYKLAILVIKNINSVAINDMSYITDNNYILIPKIYAPEFQDSAEETRPRHYYNVS